MLNIVVPMAGRGQRFIDAGYTVPKPLIPVHGVPMIRVVIDNLRPAREHRFIFLCLREHLADFRLGEQLHTWAPGSLVLPVDRVTEGAACTVLLAREHFDDDAPLMIANCDQWVDAGIDTYLAASDPDGVDGLIMTMWADDPKWSFARIDAHGLVSEVVEKQVVSNDATVGIYNYRRGRDYVRAAEQMIARNLRVNNEFYVAPVYNQLIETGARVSTHGIGRELDGLYGLGTPADLERFIAMPVSARAVAFAKP